ncbi:lipopolysaccharide biosynthesis protein [Cognatishimia activa]|nr:lipopolysaccharide biosynthesis protein [Cognatishimia activa]
MKGALWIAIGRLLANALGLISTLILARILVPEDFGLVAISTAFMAILTSITDMPVSEALIQHKDPKKDHFHTAFTISAIRGAIIGLAMVFCAGPVAQFYGDERLREILQVLALGVFLLSLLNPRLILFQRELVFHQIFIMQISEKAVGFIAAVAVALIYQSYWALIIGALASEMTRVLLSYVLRPFLPRFTLLHWRELLSFSIWLTLGNCAQALNWRANPLVYGAVLPTNFMGLYGFGNRVTGVLFDQLDQPIRQTLYPAFSRLNSDIPALGRAYLRAQGILCLVVFPFATAIIFLAAPLVTIAVGDKWLLAVPVIQIQAMMSAAQSMVALQPIAMATDNTKKLFYRSVRVIIVRWPIVGIAIWVAWPFGPNNVLIAAMLGSLVATAVNVVWNMTLVRSIAEIPLRNQLGLGLRPVLACIATALVLSGLGTMLPMTQSSLIGQFLQLLAFAFAGLACYAISIAILWRVHGKPKSAEVDLTEMIVGFYRKLQKRLKMQS